MNTVVIILLVLGIVLVLKGKPLYQFFVDPTIDGMISVLVILLVLAAFFLFAVP